MLASASPVDVHDGRERRTRDRDSGSVPNAGRRLVSALGVALLVSLLITVVSGPVSLSVCCEVTHGERAGALAVGRGRRMGGVVASTATEGRGATSQP